MADRAAQPIVYRYAIFVKERNAGKFKYNRRPYDVVELDWKNGERNQYIQPILGRASMQVIDPTSQGLSSATGGNEIIYDDIWIFTSFPDYDLCMAPRDPSYPGNPSALNK